MNAESILQLVEELKPMTAYDNARVVEIMQVIADAGHSMPKAQKTDYYEKMSQTGYADVAVKMRRWYNAVGVFRDDVVWTGLFSLLSTLWNMSDGSYTFSAKLLQAGYLKIVVADLQHEQYKSMMAQHAQVRYLIRADMSTINNCSRVNELRELYYQEGIIEAVTPFCKMKEPGMRTISYMILANLMREDDAGGEKVVAADDVIGLLVEWLKGALDSETRHAGGGEFSGGFSPVELITVIKKLAAEDRSKQKFMDANVLPSLKRMLSADEYHEEQQLAAETIANLAFDNEIRAKLSKDSELMAALNKLLLATDGQVKRAASSALWILNESSKQVVHQEKQAGHIMISYCWSDQKTMMQVRDKLKEAGHVVWMDIDSMTGSTLQAMAEAVEQATLVVMCCSESYKKSPNCRIEAEYAFQRQKLILPLMMQRGYKPDGWLGIMIGPKLFVDFSGKYPFEKSWQNMQQQLKHCLEGQAAPTATQNADSATSKSHSNPTYVKWNQDDVKRWLKENNLERYAESFKDMDGADLEQIQIMFRTAPDAYYRALNDQLCLQFKDSLRFTRSLSALN